MCKGCRTTKLLTGCINDFSHHCIYTYIYEIEREVLICTTREIDLSGDGPSMIHDSHPAVSAVVSTRQPDRDGAGAGAGVV